MTNIGEFARLGGVSTRRLRHYDAIGMEAAGADRTTPIARYPPQTRHPRGPHHRR